MDEGWWDLGFSLLGQYFTDNEGEEARMIDVVMDYRWRNQCEHRASLI